MRQERVEVHKRSLLIQKVLAQAIAQLRSVLLLRLFVAVAFLYLVACGSGIVQGTQRPGRILARFW